MIGAAGSWGGKNLQQSRRLFAHGNPCRRVRTPSIQHAGARVNRCEVRPAVSEIGQRAPRKGVQSAGKPGAL